MDYRELGRTDWNVSTISLGTWAMGSLWGPVDDRESLASGLLTGKMTSATTFARDDHRTFNRQGRAFDRGETFSGVDYETGLQAVEELRPLVPQNTTMAQLALRWILMFDAVTCAVPGAKRPAQAEDNIRSADLPPLSGSTMEKIRAIYDRRIRAHVHHLWQVDATFNSAPALPQRFP